MMQAWKPICECMRIVAQSIASVVGFRDPAAKGAIVRGIKAADMRRSKVQ